jgi:transcriptional regulator with XRE-family HTH domain
MNVHHGSHGSPATICLQAPLPPEAIASSDNAQMEAKLAEVLGARLLQARKRAKLTQQQTAEELGITHSAVGQWERGEELPSLLNLIYVAETYPASLDWLVWGMGNNLDARVRKLPAILREPLLERLNREIEDAEKLVRRLPTGFSNEVVHDDDGRLNKWSAAGKESAERKEKVPVKRPKDGTQ